MSRFGDLVKKLRMERGMTLEQVARKIGSQKGYVSGIENDKVNPPSVKIIKKYATLLGQDARAIAPLDNSRGLDLYPHEEYAHVFAKPRSIAAGKWYPVHTDRLSQGPFKR